MLNFESASATTQLSEEINKYAQSFQLVDKFVYQILLGTFHLN